MWNMFHCFVTMKVLLRLLTISCNILELRILKFVIISFEIMMLRETPILSMFVPISNWQIYIHQTAWWESILPFERWIEHHWCLKLGVETPFGCMQCMSLWLILDISLIMMIICLGYICTLACYLTLVGTWMNLNLWDCNSLTSWAISTSPSLYTMVVENKEAQNPSNISFDKLYVKFYDRHFGYTSALPCRTNPCR